MSYDMLCRHEKLVAPSYMKPSQPLLHEKLVAPSYMKPSQPLLRRCELGIISRSVACRVVGLTWVTTLHVSSATYE
jgi:hypothetical protein